LDEAEATSESRSRKRGLWRWVRGSESAIYVLAAALSLGAVIIASKLWLANWRIPFNYRGDAVLYLAHFKTVFETGWFDSSGLLGAPIGQTYFDYHDSDNLQYLWADVLTHIIRNPFIAANLYYIIGYPLAALAAAWFLREVGVSRLLTIALATLYAIAPYHFVRAENHFWLAGYYAAPLLLIIVFRVMAGRPLWGIRPNVGRVRGVLTGRGAATVVMALIGASVETYYAFFAVALLGCAGLISLAQRRDWRKFFGAVAAGLAIVLWVGINVLPDSIYSLLHGANPQAIVRSPLATSTYAFRLTDLLLPVPHDRIAALASLRSVYQGIFGAAEEPALGVVAGAGLIAALSYGIYRIAVGRRNGAAPSVRSETIGQLSALTLFSFLVSTVGGLGLFVAFFTSELRGLNRQSILLALFCLAIVGLLLDALIERFMAARLLEAKRYPAIVAVVALLVLVVGFVDQTPPGLAVPSYAANAAAFATDANMVSAIQRSMPSKAAILQLPYRRFPETAPVNGVNVSDQLLPYLHSSTLRWSGGGIKGRPSVEWQTELGSLPAPELAVSAAAAGFSGILVDKQEAGPMAGPQLVASLTADLGAPTVTTPDGRYAFFDLAPAQSQLQSTFDAQQRAEIGSRTLQAVYVYDQPDYDLTGYNLISSLIAGVKPAIILDNPSRRTVRLCVSFTMSYADGPVSMTLALPGHNQVFDAGPQGTAVTFTIEAAPGKTVLPITRTSGAPFGRTDALPSSGGMSAEQIMDISSTDLTLKSLLSRVPAAPTN
jgi:hypothetical protein